MMVFDHPVPEDPVIPRDLPPEAEEELESYWDDANGGWLDPKLVRAARAEELAAIKSYEVYVKRPIKECLEVTGKKPMPIRWVDTNKGDDENPEYRSRIVAKDLKTKRDPNMPAIDSFAPMPALEMMKLLLSLASMWRKTSRGGTLVIMVVDVRKAHWNAAARRTIYIKLPEEDHEEGMCGLCLKSLYGFLDAASCWNDEVSDMLTENGFHVGKASPALFRHDGEEILGLVHGDDFLTLSDSRGQDFFESCLAKRYRYKMRGR